MSRGRVPQGFWPVWTAVVVDLLGFGIVIPLLPLYASRFGASPLQVGLLFASYSLAQFVFSPIWGKVSDRVGRRPVLLLTIAGSAVGSLVLGLAGSVAILFVGRIIDGISGASIAVARAAVADSADDGERPRLMGLLGAAFGIGFVAGPVLGSVASLAGPSAPFFVAAAISLVNLAVAAVRLPETRRDSRAVPARDDAAKVVSGPVLRFIVVTFTAITAFAAFEATFALLGEVRYGMTESVVALAFAGVGAVLVLTQAALVGPVAARMGEAATIRLGLGLDLVGFLLIGSSRGWPTLMVGLAVLAMGQGLVAPSLSSMLAGMVPPERSGAVLGAQQSAGGLARVVGPVLGGALFAIGAGVPYVVAALLTLVVLPLLPTSRRVSLEGT